MSDLASFGSSLRLLISGLLDDRRESSLFSGPASTGRKNHWARSIDRSPLPELFGAVDPEPELRTFPKSGVYHVLLKTTDIFVLPGRGQLTVPLAGYSQVVVSAPQGGEWGKDIIYVNYTEHKLFGTHPETGDIAVTLNNDILSGGNIFPSPLNSVTGGSDMACRINIAATFAVEKLGVTLFNKTPIQISSDTLQRVPPLYEGGKAHVASLPLYRTDNPDGELVGFIEGLDYQVQGYAPRGVVDMFRAANTKRELVSILRDEGF